VFIISDENKAKLRRSLAENHGYLIAKDAERLGIPYPAFFSFARSEGLEKVASGIYVQKDVIPDSLYVFSLRHPDAVYSHSTALYLLGLSDRDPLRKEITVSKGQNPATFAKDGNRAHFVSTPLLSLGRCTLLTPQKNSVPSYDLERTLVDLVRSRNKEDSNLVSSSLKRYATLKVRKIPLLLEYAKAFRVEKIMSIYLGVLL
jgi:hypothetical protein